MIPATKRILCSIIAVLFLLNSCAPAPAATPAAAATEDAAVAQLQQTVDSLLAAQNALSTPTQDLEKVQLQQTLDSMLAVQTTQAQVTQTPHPLQQTVEALAATQAAQQATQQDVALQQTVDALFATQNAQSTQQVALEGPPPAAECVSAPPSTPADPNAVSTIESLYPDSGETYGGKTVTIEGKNLISPAGSKAVFCFGGLQATEVTCPSAERCTMNTPRNPKAGFVDVSAFLDGQTVTVAEAFEYLTPPTVSSVSPNSGPISGGTSVTISGSGFTETTTTFFFGAGNQSRTEECTPTQCTVISPGIKSDQDSVVWVQAVVGGAFSELDTSAGTRQTFKYAAPAKYACDAYLVSPGQGPFKPREGFEIQWVVKNIGANAWPAGQDVRFSSGSSGNMSRVSVVEIKKALQPNDTFTIAIEAQAPGKKGLHHMTWVVAGQGCSLYVAIKVE
jgi:hypothetical protein